MWPEQSQQPTLSLGSTIIVLKLLIISEHRSQQTMLPALLLFTETDGVLITVSSEAAHSFSEASWAAQTLDAPLISQSVGTLDTPEGSPSQLQTS